MQGNFPIVEAPEAPQVPSSNLPRSVPSPDMITTQHNATAEELRKYNCKGTALITDSGVDDNRDSKLSDEEIQETRIDCTEVVPGS